MSLHLKFKLNDHCAQYPFILSAGRQRGKVDIYDSFSGPVLPGKRVLRVLVSEMSSLPGNCMRSSN